MKTKRLKSKKLAEWIKFLCKEGCFGKWKRNISENIIYYDDYLTRNSDTIVSYIGFAWYDFNEGSNFWLNKSIKFDNLNK